MSAILITCLCTFLGQGVRPVAIVWQIGDRGNILVETAKTILLAKDLSYLLHVLVFNKH